VIDDHVRENMDEVLEQVQNGEFATEWISENQANRPVYTQLNQAEKDHEIEEVGERLRDLFSWADEATEDEAESARCRRTTNTGTRATMSETTRRRIRWARSAIRIPTRGDGWPAVQPRPDRRRRRRYVGDDRG